MIEVSDLQKSFSGRQVLYGVDLVAKAGKVTALVGPNSCGKSTFLKCLLGLVIPNSGRISFNRQLVTEDPGYRARVGYLAQTVDFPESLTGIEILDLLEKLRAVQAPRRSSLIESLSLEQLLRKPFGHLSGGAKQKLGAVCALMFDPDYILLDEPTASLDPVTAFAFRKLVTAEAKSGKTVLLVSHNMSEIQSLAHEIVFLLEGRVHFSGDLLSFLNGASLVEEALVAHLMKADKS